MSLLKNLIRNAVNDGISKGIRDAVSSAAEKIVAPKAEEYANSVANSLDEARMNAMKTGQLFILTDMILFRPIRRGTINTTSWSAR